MIKIDGYSQTTMLMKTLQAFAFVNA